MKNILITGSSGFIGKYLIEKLKNNNNLNIQTLENDLRNYDKVKQEILNKKPNIIVHLAACTEVAKSFESPLKFSETNYLGTVNLAETALQLDSFDLFLFSSTMETYGWQPVSDKIMNNTYNEKDLIPFDENTPQNPNASYAVAKLGCEKYIEYLNRSYNLPYCNLRQTNTYGRWDNDFFVVEQIITQMLNEEKVRLGNPKPYRNFLFIDDLIELYDKIINNPTKVINNTYCLGPQNAIKICDLTTIIAEKLNCNKEIVWNSKLQRPGEIYYLSSCGDKIYNHIGWKPKTDLNKGLDLTISYWKGNLNEN